MEPAKAKVIKYVFETTVQQISEHKERVYVSGFSETAVFDTVSRGWFALLEGSWEALYLGKDRPEFKSGDKVKVTIERIP